MAKKVEDNTLGITSLVMGIIGLVFFLAPYFGIFFSITGIILGGKQNKYYKTGQGTSGFVLGIIGTILNCMMLFVFIFAVAVGSLV